MASSDAKRLSITSKRMVLLLAVLCGLLYAIALAMQFVATAAIDPYGDELAFAATELVLLQRGEKLAVDRKFPAADCLWRKCADDGTEKHSYASVLAHARSQMIAAGRGSAACSALLLEHLWRDACIDLTIRAYALSPTELHLVLRFLQQPCNFAHAGITRKMDLFRCEVAGRSTKTIQAFIWEQRPSGAYAHPKHIQLISQ